LSDPFFFWLAFRAACRPRKTESKYHFAFVHACTFLKPLTAFFKMTVPSPTSVLL